MHFTDILGISLSNQTYGADHCKGQPAHIRKMPLLGKPHPSQRHGLHTETILVVPPRFIVEKKDSKHTDNTHESICS